VSCLEALVRSMTGPRLPALAFACALLGAPVHLSAASLVREQVPLDAGWRFHLADAPDASQPSFDDSGWRTVDLPHDWSIEGATSPTEPSAGGGGFFPTGVGWYRRTFLAPSPSEGRLVRVEFDGVYRNAEVWINGHRLGLHPYGYTPFRFDLTPHLRLGGENTLAVRVDNSPQPNSRWYTGSGIYRHVRLVVVDPVHLEPGGVFVATTEATAEAATVRVEWAVRNERPTPQAVAVDVDVIPTRPVTAGINGMGEAGVWTQLDPLFAALDVAGYNYERARYSDDHVRLPSRVIYGAESFPADAFASWAEARTHPWVIGDFVWSALDYLGEAGIGRVFPPGEPAVPHWEGVHYPWHGAACGDIDITGWRRPVSHHRNIVWDRGESLYVAVREPSPTSEPWTLSQWSVPPAWPRWTWPGQEGRSLQVDVSSRHDAVRLSLNGVPIGEKPTGETHEFVASFEVPYAPGVLRAVGVRAGHEVEELELVTAGVATRIRLSPDRLRIRADGQDLSFVTVEVVDEDGRLRPDTSLPVRYTVTGPGAIAGIGSGDPTARESYRANPRRVFHGRAVVVIRSTRMPGVIQLSADAAGLDGASVTIESAPW